MSDEFEVNEADAGAAKFYPAQASSIKKGGHLLIDGKPCRVTQISTSKPGKHGSAKCAFVATDIFTGKKHEAISPGHANVDVPFVHRVTYPLSDIDDSGYLNLYDENSGEMIEDIRCPEGEMGDKMRDLLEADQTIIVTVLKAMGSEKVIDFSLDTKGGDN